jgi:hypothetical protein
VSAPSAISKVEGLIASGVEEQYGITKKPIEGIHGANRPEQNKYAQVRDLKYWIIAAQGAQKRRLFNGLRGRDGVELDFRGQHGTIEA